MEESGHVSPSIESVLLAKPALLASVQILSLTLERWNGNCLRLKGMDALKNYLIRNFEQAFVLLILVSVAGINYLIPYKLAFSELLFYSHPAWSLLPGGAKGTSRRCPLYPDRRSVCLSVSRLLHACF